jgi:hypothetical protein
MITNTYDCEMKRKTIALVGYPPVHFRDFGDALENADFQVFWVHPTRSAARDHVRRFNGSAERILDSTAGFSPDWSSVERCKQELAQLESARRPLINDLILMDRMLKRKSHDFAICYLNHLQHVLTKFFVNNGVNLVTSGKDTALQLMAMLVCRKLRIPWVVPTRVRVPLDLYMFATGHESLDTVPIRRPVQADRDWGVEFLRAFRARPMKTALKAATSDFGDVIQMLPRHVRVFADLLRQSAMDMGNDYSRYTIPRIIRMYTRRRYNMLRFKLRPPYGLPGKRPFCLYALHTQPESSVDVAGSFFSDQIALITMIARSIPSSHDLYVKIHPTDVDGRPLSFYRQIADIHGVRLINYDVPSRSLIERAAIIFTLTGTIGHESALLGKPVVTFARNYYNGLPTIHYCDSPPELPALVHKLLTAPVQSDLEERLIDWLAETKARSFPGEVNRMFEATGTILNETDLRTLGEAYNVLFDLLLPRNQSARLESRVAQTEVTTR